MTPKLSALSASPSLCAFEAEIGETRKLSYPRKGELQMSTRGFTTLIRTAEAYEFSGDVYCGTISQRKREGDRAAVLGDMGHDGTLLAPILGSWPRYDKPRGLD